MTEAEQGVCKAVEEPEGPIVTTEGAVGALLEGAADGGPAVAGQRALFTDVDPEHRLSGDEKDVRRRRTRRALARDVYIPDVVDPARRAACRLDLRRFCETYMAGSFPIPWSEDQLTIIAGLQDVMLHGNRSIFVAPRGTGKTTLTRAACLWAILYGHRHYLVILCDINKMSVNRLKSLRRIIETNELLLEDFPGPCTCARVLEGKYNRGVGQTAFGEQTHIQWSGTEELAFPSLPGTPSSGSVIATVSMESALQGLQHTQVDGTVIRPDIVLLDDPITPGDAHSTHLVEKGELKIEEEVIGLAGPDTSIAAVYLATLFCRDDLTSRFFAKSEWRGHKFKMIYAWPEREDLWDKYTDLYHESYDQQGDLSLATEFYLANRQAMDKGAKVAWEGRFRAEKGEVSAIQCAMDHFIENEAVFWAQYQNEPRDMDPGDVVTLEAYRVQGKDTGLDRTVVPDNAQVLVCGVDVAKSYLHWTVGAVAAGRLVSIIDYGVEDVYAPTGRIDPSDKALVQAHERALLAALGHLRDQFLDDPFRKASGDPMPILFTLIDARYLREVVKTFCAENPRAYGMAFGRGTARNQPNWTHAPKKSALMPDGNVYILREADGTFTYHLHSDAYKQIVHTGFLLANEDPGSIALFTGPRRTTHHTFSYHIIAERQVELDSGKVVWKRTRGHAANHWLDATCYMMAAISLLEPRMPGIGIGVAEGQPRGFRRRPKRRQVTVTEIG